MNNRLFNTLKNKSFFFLWSSEVFSQIAMNMMNFILILVAFSITNSNTAVSGIVLAFTIPAIFFGILAGILVDMWNKKYVLFATNIIRAVLLLVLAFAHSSLIGIYILTFIISIFTQFFIPAETPMIPLLVSNENLLSANALFSVALYGSILIAYALSGPVLLIFGTKNSFIFLGLVFVLAALSILFIRTQKKPKQKEKKESFRESMFGEFQQALSLIIKVKNLYHTFLLLSLSQILILIIAVVGPGFAKQVLHITINAFPLIFVTPAVIGMGVGTYLLTNYFHSFPKQKSATLGLFISSIAVFFLPFSSRFVSYPYIKSFNAFLPHLLQLNILHFMVLIAFILGLSNALIFVPSNTIIQEETSDEVRGKIYGALNTVVSLISLFPIAIVGSLADVVGVATVLTVVALVIAAIAVIRLFIT